MKLEIVAKSKPTDDSISLYFEPGPKFPGYKPGQHALLSIIINGAVHRRTYSFHTSPYTDTRVGITVRAVDGGLISRYLQTINGTAEIFLDGISGDFVLEPNVHNKRHLVMFAAGSGITPIMAMIKTVLHHESESSVSLIYSNKNYNKIIFKEELERLQAEFDTRFKIYHILTQDENAPSDFRTFYKGRLSRLITKKMLKVILTDLNYPVEYYLCGPFGFMQIVEDSIRSVNPDIAIQKEHFYIPEDNNSPINDVDPEPRDVILQMDKTEQLLIVPGGKTILQAALDQGIRLAYSCTQGQCGACRAFLVSGAVKLRRNHILNDDELRAGQILLCQAFPSSDGITVKPRL